MNVIGEPLQAYKIVVKASNATKIWIWVLLNIQEQNRFGVFTSPDVFKAEDFEAHVEAVGGILGREVVEKFGIVIADDWDAGDVFMGESYR